jgi:hypothetical protein
MIQAIHQGRIMAKQAKAGHAGGTSGSKQRSQFDITPEEFVTAWNAARTAQEAADKLGMPKAIAQARASKYRKAGVKLKKMSRRSGRRLDVEGLNRLIAQLEAKQAEVTSSSAGDSPGSRKKGGT